MPSTVTQLLERALELPDDERAELIIRLLDTMRTTPEPAHSNDGSAVLQAAWIEEARRRLQRE